MVGQQGGDDHRELSASEYQRIEVGIKLAADVLGTEDELDAADDPQHEETFQEADDETGSDDQFDI